MKMEMLEVSMRIKKALDSEFDQIYLMGEDVWGGDLSANDYLADCRNSNKYRSGTWWVLEHDNVLVSSLIHYDFENNQKGIGSISTSPKFRNLGFASKLIKGVCEKLEQEFHANVIFLYSDISSSFYEKFGFEVLSPVLQRYQSSVCMMRSSRGDDILSQSSFCAPKYF